MSAPVHIGDLCAANLVARSTEVDGHMVLALATDSHRVDLVTGCCDAELDAAAEAFDRLAEVAKAHASLLRQLRTVDVEAEWQRRRRR